ncbi:MAG: phosphoglycerate mutase (2,3-diphosphoglycerate-independent) [Gammaproteobacteria bacterium]|nr:MAG: phosphoglycerate mutase (2,3-diphosphoglycerate-independent) [Pseudomonadota bacterium]PIE38662.1 MAG: phosphoglycerate mutase (2,3-diphosphoglycerate-independent) [Gammaproteobacteria bacterium]
MTEAAQTTALIILDGWGHREDTNHNAIANAKKPFWDKLWASRPKTLITTCGNAVGLPEGQMGNSEVGHMNLGAGRIVYQNFTRITKDVEEGTFYDNPVLVSAIDKAIAKGKAVHILGLLSPGGVHSHEDHIIAACKMAVKQGAKQLYVHAFLDGRDMPPQSALPSLKRIDEELRQLGTGRVASMTGRFYAMDRDNRWDRVEAAYNLITSADAELVYNSTEDALNAAYDRGETDEFVKASVIVPEPGARKHSVEDGDTVLFMNFRSDRARELTRAFVDETFDGFARTRRIQLADFVMLTEFAADIKASCAYPPSTLDNGLGEYLEKLGKTQLRIAETEKYAHVTFFFSGGREETYKGEDRILVPSPQVATYDLQPEMSAPEVTDKLVEAIESRKYDVIICNYANGDMVGHTGDYNAAVKAAECLDTCLQRVIEALESTGGQALVTADHGNAEQMVDPETGGPHTSHTVLPVPLVYVGPQDVQLKSGGSLRDIAPTMLRLMDLPQPEEMTGQPLTE